MSVGDITSDKPGTGARFNDGKLDVLQIPVFIYSMILETDLDTPDGPFIDWLSDFEGREGSEDVVTLVQAFRSLGDTEALLRAAIDVFCYGEKKYARYNWMKGMPWSVPIACALRHELAIRRNEHFDPESGLPHRGHIACNLIMLMYYIENYPEGDDRRGEKQCDDLMYEYGSFEAGAKKQITGLTSIPHVSEVLVAPTAPGKAGCFLIGDKATVNLGFHRQHGNTGRIVSVAVSAVNPLCEVYGVEFSGGVTDHFNLKELQYAGTC